MNIIAKNDNKPPSFFPATYKFIERRFYYTQPDDDLIRLKVNSFFIIYEVVRNSKHYLWGAYQFEK
jgi:hypothetical protein